MEGKYCVANVYSQQIYIIPGSLKTNSNFQTCLKCSNPWEWIPQHIHPEFVYELYQRP